MKLQKRIEFEMHDWGFHAKWCKTADNHCVVTDDWYEEFDWGELKRDIWRFVMDKILPVLVVVLIATLVTGIVTSLMPYAVMGPGVHEYKNVNVNWHEFSIRTMPCVMIGRGDATHLWDWEGVTCDWSQWTPPTPQERQ